MKNIHKSILQTLLLAGIGGAGSFVIQSRAQASVSACSYLDPITVDIAAFCAGIFLLIEGSIDILKHKESPPRRQWARSFRVAFGVSIVVIHIMQFVYK